MTHKRTLTAIVTLAAILSVGYGVALGTAKMLANPTAVAVVDLQAVFDGAKVREQYQAEQKQKTETPQSQQKQKQQELTDLEYDLQALNPGTDQYNDMQEQLQRKALEFNVWAQFEQAKLAKEQGLQLERLYRDTLSSISKVAAEQGYDLVIYKESAPNFRWNKIEELSGQIQIRKVLYNAESIDITSDVIQRLNNEHAAG